MSGLARLLLSLGWEVTGSDRTAGRETEALGRMGVRISVGHDAGTIDSPDIIIYSSAVSPENPELREGQRKGIRCVRRGEAVAMITRGSRLIAVTGTHGKTSASAMLVSVLRAAGRRPSYLIGGHLLPDGSNYGRGGGEDFVLEADESDGTFLEYKPAYALITNIDCEHVGYYGSMEKLVDAFGRFASSVKKKGVLAAHSRDPNIESVLPHCPAKAVTYSFINSDYGSSAVRESRGWRLTLYGSKGHIGSCHLDVVGKHNLLNATGVAALALEMGCRWRDVARGLSRYRGVSRRFEIKLVRPVTVVDDYAHHPAEVRATLAAARDITSGRVIALWQPHRPSRCRDLFDEWRGAFEQADALFVTDIYTAGERDVPGITGAGMASAIEIPSVKFTGGAGEAVSAVAREAKTGDIVVVLGAGDVTRASDALVTLLSDGPGAELA